MFKRMALAAGVAAALFQGAQAVVAESTRAGAYTIHYNAFTAETLTLEIARANAIQRSNRLGVLNVSVIKDLPGSTGTSVKALVDVDLVNDKSRKGPVAMHEAEAEGAVSYLGQFPIADGQELDFEIRVRPTGAAETTTLRLRQEFFTQ